MKIKEKILPLIFIFILSIFGMINLTIQYSKSPNKIILDGPWKYTLNNSEEFIKKEYDDSTWEEELFIHNNVIVNKEKEKINKIIWFRKNFIISNQLSEEDLMLYIPRMPNYHKIYFNGNLIGRTISDEEKNFSDWNQKYGYFIPKNLIEYEKENNITIKTYSTYEYGPSDTLTIEPAQIILKRIAIYSSSYRYMYLSNLVVLLAVSIYFFFFYIKMDQTKKYLYFSLLCFVTALYYSNYFVSVLPISYLLFQKIVVSCMFLIPVFFFLFIREFAKLPIEKAQKINMIIRIIMILVSVFVFTDLISYYTFRRYFFFIFALDFFVIFFKVIVDYFRKNVYIKKLTLWICLIFVMCCYDIYYEMQGMFPPIGFQLNVYAIMCFLSLVALDLGKEYIEFYTKAVRDGLTGLYTQSFFKNELVEMIAEKEKIKNPISIMMLDIDHFKKFNDTYGHLMGDEVLKAVSNIIEKNASSGAIVSRYGGEEFAVLIKDCREDEAIRIGENIRKIIEDYCFKDNEKIKVTISVGITTWDPSKIIMHSEALIKEADDALYYSKHNGRNKVTHHQTIRYEN